MKYEAYWIKPDGKILPVAARHIDLIVKDPEVFDLTKEYVKEQFEGFNEPLGREGKARRLIMEELINSGFIRVRFKPGKWVWYMECNQINSDSEKQVEKWIKSIEGNTDDIRCRRIILQEIEKKRNIPFNFAISESRFANRDSRIVLTRCGE